MRPTRLLSTLLLAATASGQSGQIVLFGDEWALSDFAYTNAPSETSALARAIALEPEVMLYDEPTTGLDPIRSDVINELILALTKQLGMTSIVVTHDMTSANKIADRMVLLYDGQVAADSDPESFRRSRSELVQRFIRGQADQNDLELIRMGFAQQQVAEAQPKKTYNARI